MGKTHLLLIVNTEQPDDVSCQQMYACYGTFVNFLNTDVHLHCSVPYRSSVRTSRRTQFVSTTNSNLLLLSKEIIGIVCQIGELVNVNVTADSTATNVLETVKCMYVGQRGA